MHYIIWLFCSISPPLMSPVVQKLVNTKLYKKKYHTLLPPSVFRLSFFNLSCVILCYCLQVRRVSHVLAFVSGFLWMFHATFLASVSLLCHFYLLCCLFTQTGLKLLPCDVLKSAFILKTLLQEEIFFVFSCCLRCIYSSLNVGSAWLQKC